MSYIRKTKLLTIVGLCLLFSCEKEISVNIPEREDKLVIHSTFRPFTAPYVKDFRVQLTKSTSILDNQNIDTIANANITLFENNTIIDTLTYIDSIGIYSSDKFPKSRKEYRIEVEKTGFPEIIATDIVPEKTEVLQIGVEPIAYHDNEFDSYLSEITLMFKDDGATENYYEVILKEAGTNHFPELSTNDISIVNERYYPSQLNPALDYPSRLLFSDTHFNGSKKYLSFFFKPAQYIEFENGEPVYFYNNQIIEVYFRSVSESYFNYYRSLIEKLNNQEGDILYGMAEPFEIPSNVEGGFGIFAGYQVDIKQFRIEEQRIN